MKKIIHIILILISLWLHSNGQNSCPPTNSLNIGTGLTSSYTIGTIGSYDANWLLTQWPSSFAAPSTSPLPAYIIPDTWGTGFLLGSLFISPLNSSAYSVNNCGTASNIFATQFLFTKKFELITTSTIHIDLKVLADDAEAIYLDGAEIAKRTSGFSWTLSNMITISKDTLLKAGCHKIELGLVNCGGAAMGIKATGMLSVVSAANNIKNNCCENLGMITGLKYLDANSNAIRESSESLLSGWVIELRDNLNNLITTQTTSTLGQYSFSGLAPGTYHVCEQLQSGWNQTQPGGGTCYTIVLGLNEIKQAEFGNIQSPPCTCGSWGSSAYTIGNNLPNKLNCNNPTTLILTANKGESFTFTPNYICTGTNGTQCQATYKYDIYYPGGTSLLNQTSLAAFKLDSCGINRIVMTPYCNGVACPPCEFTINVNCCHCNQLLTPIIYGPLSTGKDSAILACGQTYTNLLDCFKSYIIKVKNPCGETCNPDEVITTIKYPNGTTSVSSSVLGVPLSIGTDIGNYEVLIQVKCNGVWCKECKIIFTQTKACQPPCDNCTVNGRPKVQASFYTDGSSVTLQPETATTSSTLNASIALGGGTDTYTQLRINVVDIQVSGGDYLDSNHVIENKACLSCYNTANHWGSILGGTLSISGFTSSATTFSGVDVTNLNNNSREIVFDAATPTIIPMATLANINIKVPGLSALSCCCIRVTLFLKVTYRNNKCEECSKIVKVIIRECPSQGNNGGTSTFDKDGGHPQYKIKAPNKDANKPVNFSTEKNKSSN